MLLWFADLMNVTEEVTIHRPNVSTLLSSAFIRGDLNAATRGPSQLNDDRKHLVRAEVSSILRRAKPPPKNIQKDIFNALIALKKDPDRLVLSADKGNCVVVMDKQQYHDKALSLLNDKNTYAVLNSDPTSKTQRKLNKM